LDMRHTLPNLKNLLLTLTDGEDTRPVTPRIISSPLLSASGLESPPTLELTPASDTNSPRQSDNELIEGNTPLSSGATTPTAPNHDRKLGSLLGLYPLAGFLRSRYPSVVGRPSVKSVPEDSEGGSENGEASTIASHHDETGEDDEDRRTIRGVVSDGTPDQKGEKPGKGHTVNGARLEKCL